MEALLLPWAPSWSTRSAFIVVNSVLVQVWAQISIWFWSLTVGGFSKSTSYSCVWGLSGRWHCFGAPMLWRLWPPRIGHASDALKDIGGQCHTQLLYRVDWGGMPFDRNSSLRFWDLSTLLTWSRSSSQNGSVVIPSRTPLQFSRCKYRLLR